jgi:tungstate transport system substrate-binding protein
VILATTSSVQNSGLLDRLAPEFQAETRIELRVHQVGSGRALQMLKRQFADVVISHAPAAEAAFLQEFPGARYRKIMFNDFVVVGPSTDPAGVRAARDAADAFTRIATSGEQWISRGDESGTHEREKDLWTQAARMPDASRVTTTGQGMSATLRQADGRGYTLTDRATFLQLQPQIDLRILHEGDERLVNTYAVVTHGGDRESDARTFADWLVAGRGRSLIEAFEIKRGVSAFTVWPPGCPGTRPAALPCRPGGPGSD